MLLGVCLLGANAPSPVNQGEFQRGKEAFQRKEYDVALKAFGEAIQLQPGDVRAYLFRARVYQQLEQWDSAVKELHAAAQQSPSGRITAAIGYCHHMGKNSRLGLLYTQEAVRMGCRSSDVLSNLGLYHLTGGDFAEAQKCFQEALEGDPNLRNAHLGLVALYFNAAASRLHKPIPKEAYFHARQAVELGPPSRLVYALCAYLTFRAEEVTLGRGVENQRDLWAYPDASERRRGLEYMRQAIAHGEDPKTFATLLKGVPSLRNDKAFQELLTLPVGSEPSIRFPGRVNPLEYHAPAASKPAG